MRICLSQDGCPGRGQWQWQTQLAHTDGDLDDTAGHVLQVTKGYCLLAPRGRKGWGSNAACWSTQWKGQKERWTNSAHCSDNQECL